MKKVLCAAAVLLCLMTSCAWGSVYINNNTFPDDVFRAIVSSKDIDWNEDGLLSDAEIAGRKVFTISKRGISSLKGIEWFTSLEQLNCSGNSMDVLDLSRNDKLTHLWCNASGIREIHLSDRASPKYINCSGNNLTEIDFSGFSSLISLDCEFNLNLETLDVSGCTSLRFIQCYVCDLKNLDLTGCSSLHVLQCYANSIEELNLEDCKELYGLECRYNKLHEIDLTENRELVYLMCSGNYIEELDVSTCPNLVLLQCNHNGMKSLNVGGCSALKILHCNSNQLSSIDLGSCSNLTHLYCQENNIENLDVSGNRELSRLVCSDNSIKALDLSNQSHLSDLVCYDNQIPSLNLRESGLQEMLDARDYQSHPELQGNWLHYTWPDGENLSSYNFEDTTHIYGPASYDLLNVAHPSTRRVSFDNQLIRNLEVTHDPNDPILQNDLWQSMHINYTYSLDLSKYMPEEDLLKVFAGGIKAYDENNFRIPSENMGNLLEKIYFPEYPSRIVYLYQTGVSKRFYSDGEYEDSYSPLIGPWHDIFSTMEVTIGGTEQKALALNGHIYRIYNWKMDYNSAKEYCESLGGHLATINSDAERELIYQLLEKARLVDNDPTTMYWLGGERPQSTEEASWEWISGEEFTENIEEVHETEKTQIILEGDNYKFIFPDNYVHNVPNAKDNWGVPHQEVTRSKNGAFLQISYEGKLIGRYADYSSGFICEWEPVAVDFPEYTQEYRDYLENPAAYTSGDNFYGVLPDARDLSHLSGSPAHFVIDELPGKYDPRTSGLMTAVRDQGNYQTCWAFATLGALETSYNLQTSGDNAPYLSRLHMVWYVYRDVRERYTIDFASSEKQNPLLCGGNVERAVAFLSRAGTALDNDFPYSFLPAYDSNNDSPSIAHITRLVASSDYVGRLPENYNHPIRLKEAHWLDSITESNRKEVKQLIHDYGAVAATYYSHGDGYRSNGDKGVSYYFQTAQNTGHIVMIVGWDDDYTADNFPSKGAWLVKNSWGSRFGDGGYFWMSYAQTIGHTAFFKAVGGEVTSPYGYDTVAALDRINYPWSANVFQARKAESLNEVSFQTAANDVSYDIYVNVFGNSDPQSPGRPGTPIKSGHLDYNGYQTVTLDNPVQLAAGQWFSVIVKLTPDSEGEYATSVEDNTLRSSDNSAPSNTFSASENRAITFAGRSFFASKDIVLVSADWTDGQGLTTSEGEVKTCNASIRIYSVSGSTSTNPNPTPSNPTPTPEPEPDTSTGSNEGGGGGGCMTGSGITGLIAAALFMTAKRRR